MIERGGGRPDCYKLMDGTKVPSVTTICGRFKESGPLIYWAHAEGMAGRKLYESRDKAADAGSLVHSMVEAHIHGDPMPTIPEEHKSACDSAYRAWLEWWESTNIRVIATEVPLVSECYKFGGTIDAIGINSQGAFCLPDWKSSNALYADYLIQISAYARLWSERRHQDITGGFHLCRFSKEHGDFEHRFFPNLDEAWELFLLYRKAYDIDQKLKKRIR